MFEGFDRGRDDGGRARRWFASTAVAAIVYGGLGAGVLLFAKTREIVAEKEIEVSFEQTVKKEAKPLPPPPPPPPPPPAAEKPRPKVASVKPRPAPVAPPKEMPEEAPPEKDPGDRAPPGEPEGEIGGEPGGTGPVGEAPPPPPPPSRRPDPINLPEEATPPVPSSDNAMPVFPEEMRKAGTEGQVILKVVVTESGRVTNIQVMRGDPPFVDAAVAAVKTWTFEPARLAGKPIAVFRILKIPFRLSVGGG